MNHFQVGQKVVSLKSAWFNDEEGFQMRTDLPVMGQVYTVAKVSADDAGVFIALCELDPFSLFLSTHFRPVSERKIDISQFKAMLNPQKEQVPA
ncbi:hypothetical protein HGP16_25360 [Rhizobium sp. P40RR-XXII]|uniref:hypothetical protein n=1 Tax=Rhizobium sp. P40RR-XXII TaxID=2726739 RepID=UPI001456B98D|nr:hypothetical protein [Rhizobium sp. P40RR-XXII]NLS19871.1 hypothetical protein [Rhizobium sp. P40RR-XXII]